MADPITVTCSSACTVTLELKISLLPFDLSIESAGQIAVAIAAVWAVAWVFRTLAEFISSDGNSTKDET